MSKPNKEMELRLLAARDAIDHALAKAERLPDVAEQVRLLLGRACDFFVLGTDEEAGS